MRSEVDPQSSKFHDFWAESRVPADSPLRRVKKLTESALSAISVELDGLYARTAALRFRRSGCSRPNC